MSSIKGIYAASMSIFKEDFSLNLEQTKKHAENLIDKGCHGVVILGSTGQAQLISVKEKMELIEHLSNSSQKNNFIIGTGNNSLTETINMMKHSKENGFNLFLLMPPAYYQYGDEGAYIYYSKIIDKVPDCKIILYNFEKLCGYAFSIDVVERLAKDFPNQIVGVKDSTYNLYEKLKINNFLIFLGSETKLLKGLELGCNGIISAVCNVTAPIARKVYDDFINKKPQTVNKKLCAIRKAFDKHNLISALHSFKLNENSVYNKLLPPLMLLNEKDHRQLLSELKSLGFIPESKMVA
jgi:4-hydroxy-tetrahydrodipicolinate synthase